MQRYRIVGTLPAGTVCDHCTHTDALVLAIEVLDFTHTVERNARYCAPCTARVLGKRVSYVTRTAHDVEHIRRGRT